MTRPDRPLKRHPAIVTADRLLDAAATWGQHLTGQELRAVCTAQEALRRVGELERDRPRLTPAEVITRAVAARTAASAGRGVERAIRALAVMGDDCPPGRRRVAEVRIAYPEATWDEIAAHLGVRRGAAWISFSRLCESAEALAAAEGGE